MLPSLSHVRCGSGARSLAHTQSRRRHPSWRRALVLLSGKRQARMLYERALQRLLPVCDALPIGGGDAGRGRGRGSGSANAKLAKYHCWSRACFFQQHVARGVAQCCRHTAAAAALFCFFIFCLCRSHAHAQCDQQLWQESSSRSEIESKETESEWERERKMLSSHFAHSGWFCVACVCVCVRVLTCVCVWVRVVSVLRRLYAMIVVPSANKDFRYPAAIILNSE